MKRLVFILVLGLLARMADAAFLPIAAGQVHEPAHVSAAMQHHAECSEDMNQPGTDSPAAQHSLPKCHSCCPAFGLYQAYAPLPASPPHGLPSAHPQMRPYTDVTYAIDKPPKAAA